MDDAHASSRLDLSGGQQETVDLASAFKVAAGGTFAFAGGHSRQHVGDVINQYFGLSEGGQIDRSHDVLEWIMPSKAATGFQALVHSGSRNRHDPQTCRWYTHGDDFREWFSGRTPYHWLCGTGKLAGYP